MNAAFSYLYKCGYWVPSDQGALVGKLLLSFLQCYSRCAGESYRAGQVRFPVMPKLHMVHHCACRLLQQAARSPWVQSPLATSVQMEEDFIGKPARLSRRVAGGSLIHVRVMERTLVATMFAIKKADVDKRGMV